MGWSKVIRRGNSYGGMEGKNLERKGGIEDDGSLKNFTVYNLTNISLDATVSLTMT